MCLRIILKPFLLWTSHESLEYIIREESINRRNMFWESNVTFRHVHVPMRSTEKVVFAQNMKRRGVFGALIDSFCLYGRFCFALLGITLNSVKIFFLCRVM